MRTDTERLNFLLQVMESEDEDAAERIQGAFMLGLKGRPAIDAAMGAKLVVPGEPMPELTALDLAVAELGRIRNVKGFSEERDDGYVFDELANAAACYLSPGVVMEETNLWPWDDKHWKPSPDDRKRELTKGIALALCELDRLIRAERREAIERTDAAYVHPSEQAPVVIGIDLASGPDQCVVDGVLQPREFKVGDQVRVLSNAHDNPFGYSRGMDEFAGNVYTIAEVTRRTEGGLTGYRIGCWLFPAEQLEHVDG